MATEVLCYCDPSFYPTPIPCDGDEYKYGYAINTITVIIFSVISFIVFYESFIQMYVFGNTIELSYRIQKFCGYLCLMITTLGRVIRYGLILGKIYPQPGVMMTIFFIPLLMIITSFTFFTNIWGQLFLRARMKSETKKTGLSLLLFLVNIVIYIATIYGIFTTLDFSGYQTYIVVLALVLFVASLYFIITTELSKLGPVLLRLEKVAAVGRIKYRSDIVYGGSGAMFVAYIILTGASFAYDSPNFYTSRSLIYRIFEGILVLAMLVGLHKPIIRKLHEVTPPVETNSKPPKDIQMKGLLNDASNPSISFVTPASGSTV